METRYLSIGFLYILGFQIVTDVEIKETTLYFNNTEVRFPENWKPYINNMDCLPLYDLDTLSVNIVDYFNNVTEIDTIIQEISLAKTVIFGNIFTDIPEEMLTRLKIQLKNIEGQIVSYEDLLKNNLDIPITVYEILSNSIKHLNNLKEEISNDFTTVEAVNEIINFKPRIYLEDASSTLIIRKLLETKGYLDSDSRDSKEVTFSDNLFGWLNICGEEIINISSNFSDLEDILHEVLIDRQIMLCSSEKIKDYVKRVLIIAENYEIAACNQYIEEYLTYDNAKVKISTKKYIRSCINYICNEKQTLLRQLLNKMG